MKVIVQEDYEGEFEDLEFERRLDIALSDARHNLVKSKKDGLVRASVTLENEISRIYASRMSALVDEIVAALS
jgi:hypothetical protein